MAVRHYETEEEMDDAFDRIEELNLDHWAIKDEVKSAESDVEECKCELDNAIYNLIRSRKNLREGERELAEFEDKNREFLIDYR